MLCTGKVYYDLVANREERGYDDVAIVRVEQLYPLRKDDLLEILSVYAEGTPVVWVQEEPKNMGAWAYVKERSEDFLPPGRRLEYVGRAAAPSPATGNAGVHKKELEKFLGDAFG